MVDYKKLYLNMVNATEEAIQLLIQAQQNCEAAYMDAEKSTLYLLPDAQNHLGSTENSDT